MDGKEKERKTRRRESKIESLERGEESVKKTKKEAAKKEREEE